MKKMLGLVLSGMLIVSMVGCSSDTGNTSNTDDTQVKVEKQAETTETEAEEVKDEYPKSQVEGKFKVGDSVEIVDLGSIYSSYNDFFKEYNLPTQSWECGADEVKLNSEYKVVYLNKHSEDSDNTIYLIEDVETKQTYLFGEDGLSKYDGKGEVKTTSYTENFFEEEYIEEETETTSFEYEQALKAAEDYLDYTSFSKQGLYEQLTSEYGSGFSNDAAQYAVDNVNADWYAEAVEAAEDYLDYTSFSKQGLYEQLTSEYGSGFTDEEAQYAVDVVYK